MIFEILLSVSVASNAVFAAKKVLDKFVNNKPPKEPEIRPIVQELISSLENDEGWFYQPYNKETNTCDQYKNKFHSIRCSLHHNIENIERFGGVLSPYLISFTLDEKEKVEDAINKWKLKQIRDERIKGLDTYIQEVSKEPETAYSIIDKKTKTKKK